MAGPKVELRRRQSGPLGQLLAIEIAANPLDRLMPIEAPLLWFRCRSRAPRRASLASAR